MGSADPASARRSLLGLRLEELERLLESRTRALSLLRWLHAPKPSPAPPIGHVLWRRLQERHVVLEPQLLHRTTAQDGTTKHLLALGEAQVETVSIPAPGRTTVCLSSQAGCTRHCRFCATAALGFSRNLLADEMVAQFVVAARAAPPQAPARNVVFMGMGEPMDNLEEVLRAVELLTQAPAPQLKAERITVSTSGVLPGIERFLRECRASLALSLNATTDAQREALMPHSRHWPIDALLGALRSDARLHPRRVHFIEYVLFEGLNDTDADAQRLVALLKGMSVRLNLIPHNPFPGSAYCPPSFERAQRLQRQLTDAGVRCLLRWPKGEDIAAACGQLARRTELPRAAR